PCSFTLLDSDRLTIVNRLFTEQHHWFVGFHPVEHLGRDAVVKADFDGNFLGFARGYDEHRYFAFFDEKAFGGDGQRIFFAFKFDVDRRIHAGAKFALRIRNFAGIATWTRTVLKSAKVNRAAL